MDLELRSLTWPAARFAGPLASPSFAAQNSEALVLLRTAGNQQSRWASGRACEEFEYEEDPYDVRENLRKQEPSQGMHVPCIALL